MFKAFRKFLKSEDAVASAEYTFTIMLLSAGLTMGLGQLGDRVCTKIQNISQSLNETPGYTTGTPYTGGGTTSSSTSGGSSSSSTSGGSSSSSTSGGSSSSSTSGGSSSSSTSGGSSSSSTSGGSSSSSSGSPPTCSGSEVLVCQTLLGGTKVSICIDLSLVGVYLSAGATLGSCP